MLLLVILHSSFVISANAGPRTSTDYSAITETADYGGAHSSSANYSADSSASTVAGLQNVASPAEVARSGFIGQLFEIAAIQLAASPATINETATRQIAATVLLDDATTLNVSPASIAWSVQSGPITSIDANGLATAATVPQNTGATVQAAYLGITGSLNLTVLDTIADNFGTYASDGLPDSWQTQHFGANNPNAGPNANPDGDGYSNLIEFAFGTDPTSSGSGAASIAWSGGILTQHGQPVANAQNITGGVNFRAVFCRRKDYASAGLIYRVQFSGDLTTWQTSTATPSLLASDSEIDAVSVPYPFFVGGKKARFFRVTVTGP